MSSFAVVTFGCRVNQADSLELERDLRLAGLRPAQPGVADVVVVNTCSVTATADQGARQTIRRLHRDNPRAGLIVTGCYATRCAGDLCGLPGVVTVVENQRKPAIAQTVLDVAGQSAPADWAGGDGPCGASIEPGIAGRTAWTLRVQTGCEEACAYCIIPATRGQSRSRPLREVVAEVSRAAAAGFKEIVVTGVHLGSWGRDLEPASTLVMLLRALVEHPADVLFRISSLEPMDCTGEVRALLATSARFAPHVHLPLQHASDDVLRAMQRPYSLEYYAGLVDWFACALPHASIGSDVLVGFPGERDEDHARNVAWLERSPLTHLHVFPYSDRPGTAASRLPGKVHGSVIRGRADEVRRVGADLARRFRTAMCGTVRPGLTLDAGTLVVTDNYLKVRIPEGVARNVRVHVEILTDGNPIEGVVVRSP